MSVLFHIAALLLFHCAVAENGAVQEKERVSLMRRDTIELDADKVAVAIDRHSHLHRADNEGPAALVALSGKEVAAQEETSMTRAFVREAAQKGIKKLRVVRLKPTVKPKVKHSLQRQPHRVAPRPAVRPAVKPAVKHAKPPRKAFYRPRPRKTAKELLELRRMQMQIPESQLANITQVLVLTIAQPLNQMRLRTLVKQLNGIGFIGLKTPKAFNGVDAHRYKDEADEMMQDTIPMSQQQRLEWMDTDFGGGKIHHGKSPENFPSNGALAASLGHHHLWELAAATPSNDTRAWTLILEDDAMVLPAKDQLSIRQILSTAPPGVEIVYLDDRHCQYFGGRPGVRDLEMNPYAAGATAYAITSTGAKLLLAEPFRYGADHWLNMPETAGKMKALCPTSHVFIHEYNHATTIINNPSLLQKVL